MRSVTVDETAPVPAHRADADIPSCVGTLDAEAIPQPTPPTPRRSVENPLGAGVAGRIAPVRSAVIRDHDDLDALAADWDDLWRRTPSATPFQSHGWISAWAHSYVPSAQLAVAVVWSGDVLVAAAGLHRIRRGPVRVLAPLGGELSDHTDVLLDPTVQDAGTRLVATLLDFRGWGVLDLPEVLPTAAADSWARQWPGRIRWSEASLNLQLPALPVAEALARVPTRTAATLRRKLRKVEQLGVEHSSVAPADVPRAVDDLIRLHEAQWAGRRGNPEHLTARFRAHLVEALTAMIDRGQAVFVEYRVDGELVASEIDLLGHEQLAYYLAGISPDLRQRIDTAVLLVDGALGRAVGLCKSEYSFLRGLEDYKFRWRPDEVRSSRILLARPRALPPLLYFAGTSIATACLSRSRRLLRGRARSAARALMHVLRTLRAGS